MNIQENFYNYVYKRLNPLIGKQKSEDQNILFWCGIKFSKQKFFLATHMHQEHIVAVYKIFEDQQLLINLRTQKHTDFH